MQDFDTRCQTVRAEIVAMLQQWHAMLVAGYPDLLPEASVRAQVYATLADCVLTGLTLTEHAAELWVDLPQLGKALTACRQALAQADNHEVSQLHDEVARLEAERDRIIHQLFYEEGY